MATNFANKFKTESDAIAYLTKEGYKFNSSTARYERGEPFVSLSRAYVGQCRDGVWIITSC